MHRPASPLATSAIEALWRVAAESVGLRVARTDAAYASSDGKGVIVVGADELLDDDDAVAQLVFHELCHAITEGEEALGQPDWGLDNVPEHAVREHACLRVQAEIARRFGLGALMAPTTPYRDYYLALPADLRGGDGDAAAPIARAALARFDTSAWRAPIEAALAGSALEVARSTANLHPLGQPLGPSEESCGTCAWFYLGGRGTAVARCRQTAPSVGDGARTSHAYPACARWEPPVDCRSCGACCREAYHSVTVSVRDPVVWLEPDLIERTGHRFEIRRQGSRCAALEVSVAEAGEGAAAATATPPAVKGATAPARSYGCTIYENRPRPCREFAAGGRHCLDARRRVGLSGGAA